MGLEGFQVEGIDHVELFVPDRQEAAKWFEEVLGLVVVPGLEIWADEEGGPLMISCRAGVRSSHCSKAFHRGIGPQRVFIAWRFELTAKRSSGFGPAGTLGACGQSPSACPPAKRRRS